MEYISVDKENKNFIDIDGVLFNFDKTHLIKYPSSKQDKIYNVPSSVIKICTDAFNECRYLEEIILNNGLETIESFAVNYNPNIKKLIIPETVKLIEPAAITEFYGNSLAIYCYAPKKPYGWDPDWFAGVGLVVWGYND